MSVFSNARGTSERYDGYVEQLHELFHRHGVSYGRATDFMQLAPKLMRRGEFRIDFSMLLQWIQQQEAGHLTVDQMLMILGAATAGQKFTDVRTAHFAPLMVFLSGLGGWGESKGSNSARAPDSVQAEIAAAREVLREERKPVEQAPLNAATRDGPGVSGSASPPATSAAANAPVRDGTGQPDQVANFRTEQNSAIPEPASSAERISRIRQQLEELDTQAKSPKEVEAPRYKLIEPVDSAPPPWQPSPPKAKLETTAPQPEEDIFRAYRANAEAGEKRESGLKGIAMGVLAKFTGISMQEERKLRFLVRVFVFLVLLPPTVVCILLYRDSVRIASQEPSVTRVQGDELQAIDANAPRRVKGRARAGGQSKAEGSVIERAPAGSHGANLDAPPMTAEVGPDFLPETQGNRVGAENWMSILGSRGQIDVTPRAISIFDTEPAKIRSTKPEMFPMIAETQFPMSGDMPRAIVEMMYPVVISPTDSAANFGRRTPAISLASANAKMPSAGGTPTAAGLTSVKNSSTKQFNLLHPTVAVSAGLLSSEIVKFQMPDYPKAARKQRVEGDVLVRVVISKKGKIDKAVALNGPPTLRSAVEKAVRRWRYKPYMQNGQPVDVQTWVTFHFAMKEG